MDAAKKKLLDTPRGKRNQIEDEDRDAARTLLGGKGRLKRSAKRSGGLSSVWFQAAGLLVLLAGVGLTLWLVLRPPAPEKLYEQAKKLMESNDPADWDKAVEDRGPVTLYLKHYGDRAGPETQQVRTWQQQVDVSQAEGLLDRYVVRRESEKGLQVESQNDAEKDAFEAAWAENQGELEKARKLWDEVKTKYDSGSGFTRWGRVGEQHGKLVERLLGQDQAFYALKPADGAEMKGLEKDAFESVCAPAGRRRSPASPAAQRRDRKGHRGTLLVLVRGLQAAQVGEQVIRLASLPRERGWKPLPPARAGGSPTQPYIFILMIEKNAPFGSSTTAKRPTEMSVGGTHTLPPLSVIFFAAASQSSTAMYGIQCGFTSPHSAVICIMPATCWSPFLKMVYVMRPERLVGRAPAEDGAVELLAGRGVLRVQLVPAEGVLRHRKAPHGNGK